MSGSRKRADGSACVPRLVAPDVSSPAGDRRHGTNLPVHRPHVARSGEQTYTSGEQAVISSDYGRSPVAVSKEDHPLLSRRTRALLVIVAVCVVLLGASLVVLNSQALPDARLRSAIGSLVARQTTPTIDDAAGLARATGLAYLPAGITVSVVDWQSTTVDELVRARWTAVATGNGASATAPMGATFRALGDVFEWSDLEGQLQPTGLVAMVSDRGAAQRLAAETNEANIVFGTTAELAQTVVEDNAAPLPSPVTTVDPELWEDAAPRELAAAVPATRDQTYLVLGDTRHLVYQERQAAKPAEQLVGGLPTADLVGPAYDALQGFLAAKGAGDVAEGERYLAEADGLTVSGLEASTITDVPIEAMEPIGERGAYSVRAGDLLISDGDQDGQWTVDYSGQPLAVLTFGGPTGTQGQPFVPYGATSAYDWQHGLRLAPLTVRSGVSSYSLVVEGGEDVPYDGRGYSENLYLQELIADGSTIATGSPVMCEVPEEPDCAIDVVLPRTGVTSLRVSIGLGHRDTSDLYGTADFAASAP